MVMTNSNFPKMHVSYYVSNLEKTVTFYEKFFNQPVDKTRTGYAKFILEKPNLVISFIESASQVQANFGHLGFQVDSQETLDQARQLAESQELVEFEECDVSCCYAKQTKFWAVDPDGYRWEVYYFQEDAEVNDPAYKMDQEEVCCAPTIEEKEACCTPESACC